MTTAAVSTTTVVSSRLFDTCGIVQLDADNYRTRSLRMRQLFKSNRIIDIINGTTPRPATAGDDQTNWDQANNDGLTTMYLTMSPHHVRPGGRRGVELQNRP